MWYYKDRIICFRNDEEGKTRQSFEVRQFLVKNRLKFSLFEPNMSKLQSVDKIFMIFFLH